MKVLICSENAVLRDTLRGALEAAGHEVLAEAQPAALTEGAVDAGALIADPSCIRRATALLRDRGFPGRALMASNGQAEELTRQAIDLGADGALTLSPATDLARRFALAIGGRRRVLVVDDSDIVRRLLVKELEGAGFEVHGAADVESAIAIILKRTTRPDLILLDIQMPHVNGDQFCRFLKTNDRFRGIKVVLCSGDDADKVQHLAAECGADGVVKKQDVLGSWITDNQ